MWECFTRSRRKFDALRALCGCSFPSIQCPLESTTSIITLRSTINWNSSAHPTLDRRTLFTKTAEAFPHTIYFGTDQETTIPDSFSVGITTWDYNNITPRGPWNRFDFLKMFYFPQEIQILFTIYFLAAGFFPAFFNSWMRTLRSFLSTLTEPSAFVLFFKVLYAMVSNLLRCFLANRNLKRSKSFKAVRCKWNRKYGES